MQYELESCEILSWKKTKLKKDQRKTQQILYKICISHALPIQFTIATTVSVSTTIIIFSVESQLKKHEHTLRKNTTETARRHRVMPEVEICHLKSVLIQSYRKHAGQLFHREEKVTMRSMRRPALSNNHVVTPVART